MSCSFPITSFKDRPAEPYPPFQPGLISPRNAGLQDSLHAGAALMPAEL